jgi:predicted CXXCH cytochrome family protein
MAEGKACQNCHKPHSSNQARLLKGENMELCLSCHNKPIEAGKRTIANVEAQIKDSKFLHGPIRQHNCIACHEAHGSDFANILDKAFPADFYAPYQEHTYDLCFNCHDRQIVLSEKSKATGFRNGERNLHFLHVNRDKGRSCRACHDEHASNQPKHIRAEVAFGRWTFQTEYTQTPTGGGCTTGCHLPYKYDREKPIDNKPVAMK